MDIPHNLDIFTLVSRVWRCLQFITSIKLKFNRIAKIFLITLLKKVFILERENREVQNAVSGTYFVIMIRTAVSPFLFFQKGLKRRVV